MLNHTVCFDVRLNSYLNAKNICSSMCRLFSRHFLASGRGSVYKIETPGRKGILNSRYNQLTIQGVTVKRCSLHIHFLEWFKSRN